MIIESSTLDATSGYKLLIGSILPRAIAWVSTLSMDGVANLAPISFFTGVGRKPPMVSLSMQPRSDGVTLKDTFVNIRDTKEFVVNLVTIDQAHDMHRSAFEFAPEVDEFDVLGLSKESSQFVRPPRVRGAPISMECRLNQIIPIEGSSDNVVWGEVLCFHVRDDLYLERGRIDTGALNVVGRLAAEYTLVENAFTTPLETALLEKHAGRRSVRLDGRPDDYSPIDTKAWSPSGSTQP